MAETKCSSCCKATKDGGSDMSTLWYNMMSVIVTAGLTIVGFALTKRIRFCMSDDTQRWIRYGCLASFFVCSIFVIDHVSNSGAQRWASWMSIAYALLGLGICLFVVFVVAVIKRKWSLAMPEALLIYLQCFLLLYLILWHIVPFLCSSWITISLKAVKDSDRILLYALCEVGVLVSLLIGMKKDTKQTSTYQGLTKEEYAVYQSFLRNSRRDRNKY